ncbi:putative pentatricopeptide repeat domain-containing protein [Rosellinia necatrix]|uniref:Putative pentatricopeptide repeat domain-containing protein n=1 Tax=Rosellinia necatrix TaxID=77044 RepID=A0A1S7UIK1_ROSNE|nr:putative pentatricopeptide repeat domain-containing protein [Rosellinia necatrix]
MSLGLNSLWRAQSRINLVQGLSSVHKRPRGDLLFSWTPRTQTRCWASAAAGAPSPAGELEHPTIRKYESAAKTSGSAPHDGVEKKSRPRRAPARTASMSPMSCGRRSVRREMKRRSPGLHAVAMIKQPIRYPTRHASYRSLRKHIVSRHTQALHEYVRDALGKPANDWRSTMNFMMRNTPDFGEVLDFKVGIGRRAAAQARASLSELDTNIWQIQRKHHCKIRIESGTHEDAPLILSLSGARFSVQESLSDLVGAVGKVSAVRVLDPALQISAPEFWKGDHQGQPPIQLLGDGEPAAEDEAATIYGHTTNFVAMARPQQKVYRLTTRADAIPGPVIWTKSSFERYVAKLVFARVPARLRQSLYPVGPDHQSTVVHLLTGLFTSEALRPAISVSALKMALRFIHLCGIGFRPAARTIFHQAELLHLPLDAEVFNGFLASASRAGDLQGFNSALKAMHRKGHYMRAETWAAFLAMIKDPQIKRWIMKRMRSRGLQRLQPILEELGRQEVIQRLERGTGSKINIQLLMDTQDKLYGPSWLNITTLNRMMDVLGAYGNLEACHELLDLVERDRRVRPDHYTLNTMMTHTRSRAGKAALLARLPGVDPDAVTYQQLFQAAWNQRHPNMLRVIWRYSVFAGLTNQHMRHTLAKLLLPELVASNRRAFLKSWADVIFGWDELAASKLLPSSGSAGCQVTRLMKTYLDNAGNLRPVAKLADKLQEAYHMDDKIRLLMLQRAEVSARMKEGLTVAIPLGIAWTYRRSASNEAGLGVKGNAAQNSSA